MDPMIESVFADTEEILRQVNTVVLRKKILISVLIMAACAVGFAILGIVNESMVFVVTAVACMAMVVMCFRAPGRVANATYQNKQNCYGGTIPTTTIGFGEEIVIKYDESEIHISYYELKRVCVLKNCITFEAGERTWYYTPFDSFTKGSPQELLVFLTEKCPHLTVPKGTW